MHVDNSHCHRASCRCTIRPCSLLSFSVLHEKFMNNKMIAVIGVVGLILVVFVLANVKSKEPMDTENPEIPRDTQEQPVVPPPPPAPPVAPTPVNNVPTASQQSLTEEEKLILFNPPMGKDTTLVFGPTVLRLEQKGTRVSIGKSCTTNPAVLTFGSGSTVTFTNNDSAQHIVIFNAKGGESITLAPGNSESVKVGFKAGYYTYSCDLPQRVLTESDSKQIVGVVHVTE